MDTDPGAALGPDLDDAQIVAALVDKRPDGLAAVYDRFGARLHDYAVGMLRDPHAAADVVHDTLLISAERAYQLRDPNRLRPWLYAIARNECLRTLRGQGRAAALESAGDVSADVDMDAGLRAEQAHALVADAAASLSDGEREVIELALRHDLSADDIAAALGVSTKHAHALLSRARANLERAIRALAVARGGRDACPELAAILLGWDGTLTPLMRKRVNRHIDSCPVCGEGESKLVASAALFAAVPLVPLPALLRERIIDAGTRLRMVSHRRSLATRAEPFDDAGFPVPLDRASRKRVTPWVAAAVVAALLGIGAGVLVTGLGRGGSAEGAQGAAEAETSSRPLVERSATPRGDDPSVSPSRSRRASKTPRGSRSPSASTRASAKPSTSTSASASPSRLGEQSPSTKPTKGTGRPPRVTATLLDTTIDCGEWAGRVTAQVTGSVAQRVVFQWRQGSGVYRQVALSSSGGGTWQGGVAQLPAGTVQWRVVATTADGLSGTSVTRQQTHLPCIT